MTLLSALLYLMLTRALWFCTCHIYWYVWSVDIDVSSFCFLGCYCHYVVFCSCSCLATAVLLGCFFGFCTMVLYDFNWGNFFLLYLYFHIYFYLLLSFLLVMIEIGSLKNWMVTMQWLKISTKAKEWSLFEHSFI